MSTTMNTNNLITTTIYTEDANGNATFFGKACEAVAGYDVKYFKIMKKVEGYTDPNVGKYKVYYNTLADPELSPWAEISHTFAIVDSKEEAIAIVSAIAQATKELDEKKLAIKAKEKAEEERLNGTKDHPKIAIQGSLAPTNPWRRKEPV
jgi:hypothetical protein